MPKMEKVLEDVSVQPLAHLASSTVRTFELVYRDGRTDVLLAAETVEEMRRYAGLLAMVYGGLKFQSGEPCPVYLRGLPEMGGSPLRVRAYLQALRRAFHRGYSIPSPSKSE